jgi:hypothetical protein
MQTIGLISLIITSLTFWSSAMTFWWLCEILSCMVISSSALIIRMWGLLGGAKATRRCWLISWIHLSKIWRNSSFGTNWREGGGETDKTHVIHSIQSIVSIDQYVHMWHAWYADCVYMYFITYLSFSGIHSILLLTNKRKNKITLTTHAHILQMHVCMTYLSSGCWQEAG